MALSNYDLLAFDNDGKPCNGDFKFSNGTGVQIYKNWIYVTDSKSWVPDRSFIHPTIAQVYSTGSVNIAGIPIETKTCKSQNALFCFIEFAQYDKKTKSFIRTYACGLGCNAYMSDEEYLKLNYPKQYAKKPKNAFICHSGGNGKKFTYEYVKKCKCIDTGIECAGPDEIFLGVTEETKNLFFKWLKTVAPKEYIKKIDIDNCLRFNQGDAFFADKLNFKIPATKVGKQKQTILSQAFKEKKNGKTKNSH